MTEIWRGVYPSTTDIVDNRFVRRMTERRGSDRFRTPELVVSETGTYVAEQQAYLNLMRTAEVLSQRVGDLMSGHGLSGKQYNVLRAIRRGGADGLTISQISDQMTDPRADVTRLLDRLVRDGLVDRRPDHADRRVVRAHLTSAGAALLQSIDAPLLQTHRDQLGHLSQADLEDLIALLRKARGEA